MSKVDSNLVSTPTLQLGPHERVTAETLQDAVVSNRGSAVCANSHLRPLATMPPDRLVDSTAARHHPCADCEVMTLDLAPRQRGNECGVDLRRARDYEQ